MSKAYTLGDEEWYDSYLREDPNPRKRGPCEGYEGGSVWETEQDAREHLQSSKDLDRFAVYELELPGDWETCVTPDPINGSYRILQDTTIIRKV